MDFQEMIRDAPITQLVSFKNHVEAELKQRHKRTGDANELIEYLNIQLGFDIRERKRIHRLIAIRGTVIMYLRDNLCIGWITIGKLMRLNHSTCMHNYDTCKNDLTHGNDYFIKWFEIVQTLINEYKN